MWTNLSTNLHLGYITKQGSKWLLPFLTSYQLTLLQIYKVQAVEKLDAWQNFSDHMRGIMLSGDFLDKHNSFINNLSHKVQLQIYKTLLQIYKVQVVEKLDAWQNFSDHMRGIMLSGDFLDKHNSFINNLSHKVQLHIYMFCPFVINLVL